MICNDLHFVAVVDSAQITSHLLDNNKRVTKPL